MKYQAGISPEEYAAMEDGYEQGFDAGVTQTRESVVRLQDAVLRFLDGYAGGARGWPAELAGLVGWEGEVPSG